MPFYGWIWSKIVERFCDFVAIDEIKSNIMSWQAQKSSVFLIFLWLEPRTYSVSRSAKVCIRYLVELKTLTASSSPYRVRPCIAWLRQAFLTARS